MFFAKLSTCPLRQTSSSLFGSLLPPLHSGIEGNSARPCFLLFAFSSSRSLTVPSCFCFSRTKFRCKYATLLFSCAWSVSASRVLER